MADNDTPARGNDELTAEVAETLAVIRLDLDGEGPGSSG